MKSKAKARIAYAGPALDNGEMDVRELAPALLAFAGLVESASHAIGNQQAVRVMLNQDSLRRGSFDITFLLDAGILEQAKLIVGWADDTGFSDLMEILGWPAVGAMGAGIFALVKRVAGKKVTGIEHKGDGKAEIALEDGERIATDEKTLKVFLDVDCRINIEKVVRPLQRDGVDSFELRDPDDRGDGIPLTSISKEELPHFKAPSAMPLKDEIPSPPPEQEILAKIVSVNFDNGKWRLTDGTNVFWVSMQDEAFNEQVRQREVSFAFGDMLKIRYHIQQALKDGKLTSDYIVTKVLDLRKQPQQIKLDFEYHGK